MGNWRTMSWRNRGKQRKTLPLDGMKRKKHFYVPRGHSRRRQCWHSAEQEGPRLKDTRTNNQLQILFTHHLSSPNYPKKLHKEHHYHSGPVHVHIVFTNACALHLFIEERFISGLAVYLFSTNRHYCEILLGAFQKYKPPPCSPLLLMSQPTSLPPPFSTLLSHVFQF